jgi:hypothetical protein
VLALLRRPGAAWRVFSELRVEWRAGAEDRDGAVERTARVVRERAQCCRQFH